jgi:hypothetical protein
MAFAQEDLADTASTRDEIVVEGVRTRGSLDVPQAPILELDEADIAALGTTSVEEMLSAIAPQTGSTRGRGGGGHPIILVNGIRIGSFRELRSYPPEAIEKVEVLPEEVAQSLGFRPDLRVVNIILKERYSSREVELEHEFPDRGNYSASEQEFTFLRIRNGTRLNFNIEAEDTSLLTEAERGVSQTGGSQSDLSSDPDPALYRSLLPDRFDLEATANWAETDIETGSSFSTNFTYNRSESLDLSGLNSVTLIAADGSKAIRTFGELTPLERRSYGDTFSISGSIGRRIGSFDLEATTDNTYLVSETQIDRRFDSADLVMAAAAGTLPIDGTLPNNAANGFDLANRKTISSSNKVTLQGNPISLPAGDVSTTLDLGMDWERIESDDTRSLIDSSLVRRRFQGGVSASIPVAEAGGAWGMIGNFSLNGSARYEDLSDYGTLTNWTMGAIWEVGPKLNLSATRIVAENAPSISQLGNPPTVSFNVPVFDFVRGETVLATVITGGNPDLLPETQRDWKFSANWALPFWQSTRFSADYVRNRSRNVTSDFPALTAETEAAFPERVIRDESGQIDTIDARSVTYARTRSERLSFGFATRGSWGSAERAGSEGSAHGGRTRRGGRSGPGSPFGRDDRGNYFISLTHNVELESEVLIAPGLGMLDLLDGDSTSENGLPRHTTRLEFGAFKSGSGLRISGRYTGQARINGSGLPGSSDVFFDDIARFDLRLFMDLGRVFKKEEGALKNLRLTLRSENLFDAQRRIVDNNGEVPLRYQPFLVDPLGRTLRIDLRKMF